MGFTSLLNEVKELLEQELSRYDVMVDRYTKTKKKKNGKVIPPKIPLDILRVIMLSDPTTRSEEGADIDDGEIKKVGGYVQWVIKQWLGLQQEADKEYAYGSPDWGVALERLQSTL